MWSLLFVACSSPAPQVAPPAAPEAPVEAAPVAREPKAPLAESRGRPPMIKSVTITPSPATKDDALSVQVEAIDPDGERLELRFQWFINGEEVLGAISPELVAGRFKRADHVKVKVQADDGGATAEAESKDLVIANIPPVMRTNPHELTRMDGFQMRAEDADGDALSWSLDGGPRGLSISPSGILRYVGSIDEPGGSYAVKITATDPAGAWARIEVPLAVSPGSGK